MVAADDIFPTGIGQFTDQHSHPHTESEYKVHHPPQLLSAAGPLAQNLDSQGSESEHDGIQNQSDRSGTDSVRVHLHLPRCTVRFAAVNLSPHKVCVVEEEREPANPVETRHHQEDYHRPLHRPHRSEQLNKETRRLLRLCRRTFLLLVIVAVAGDDLPVRSNRPFFDVVDSDSGENDEQRDRDQEAGLQIRAVDVAGLGFREREDLVKVTVRPGSVPENITDCDEEREKRVSDTCLLLTGSG
ncbi:hypothetical protein LINPERHAP1_LOCUS1037 [Linum perenne]